MKFLKSALVALAAGAISLSANAIPFTVASTSFTLGSGYGSAAGNPGADNNLLDVLFVAASGPFTFNLAPGGSTSFNFGTVQLREACINNGDCNRGNGLDETDNLGVTANFSFASPLSQTVVDTAVTGAVVGDVSDSAVDFSINFDPVTVNFGDGGVFTIDLSDLSFSGNQTLTTMATITLLHDSTRVEAQAVPEPASLALLGVGLLGFCAARRRKL